MRVTLISTETDPWALGMRVLSSVLLDKGHESRMAFLNTPAPYYSEQVLKSVADIAAGSGMIGISCLARGSEKAKQVIRALRPMGVPIVWGGIHATLFPEDCVDWADVVCRGEGEGFITDLVGRLIHGVEWKSLANAAYREGYRIVLNPLRPLLQDLDSLPLQDHSEDRELHLRGKRFVRPSELFDVRQPVMFNGSRGCAFHCTYCINAKMREIYAGAGRYVRKMSIGRYVESVRQLKASFPKSRAVYLIDEDFFARRLDELEYFSREFPAKVGLPFECMGSPPLCTPEKADLLVKAGMWRVRLGLESGSERTKRVVYDRPITNDSLLKAARTLARHPRLTVSYFFMIGNPYEDAEDLIQTILFLASLPAPFFSQVYNLVFFPGTALYERAVADGFICGKADSGFELDYRSGLKHRDHAWKRKNLYLNGLLFLMDGKTSTRRMGAVPRCLLPRLLRPGLVRWAERHPLPIRFAIAAKCGFLSLRKLVSRGLQRVLRDPRSVYDLRRFLSDRSRGSSPPHAS